MFGLHIPTERQPGSFWEATTMNVGYVTSSPEDTGVFIGKITRRNGTLHWTLWDKEVKANTKAKTEPKAAAEGKSRSVSNAIWSMRTRQQHLRKN